MKARPEFVDVVAGDETNMRTGEADIVRNDDGSLFMAYTHFRSWEDDAAAEILSRRSTDGGRSWSNSQVVVENEGRKNVAAVSMLQLAPDRKQFVGLLTEDSQVVLPEGGQIVDDPKTPLPRAMLGHVTSSYYSANLQQSIALGLVRRGHSRMGDTVYVQNFDGRTVTARISSPVFYDPDGERQNV